MMICTHGEERTLLSWLVTQEKVLALWVEDALARAPRDAAFLAELERHHEWLAAQVERLQKREAA